jgi:hypothetical protein
MQIRCRGTKKQSMKIAVLMARNFQCQIFCFYLPSGGYRMSNLQTIEGLGYGCPDDFTVTPDGNCLYPIFGLDSRP